MLKLFVKTGCAYCAAVLKKLDDDNIPFEEVNIADEAVRDELVERGGKVQAPFLIDDERGVSMYESADIVEYLDKNYSNKDE